MQRSLEDIEILVAKVQAQKVGGGGRTPGPTRRFLWDSQISSILSLVALDSAFKINFPVGFSPKKKKKKKKKNWSIAHEVCFLSRALCVIIIVSLTFHFFIFSPFMTSHPQAPLPKSQILRSLIKWLRVFAPYERHISNNTPTAQYLEHL